MRFFKSTDFYEERLPRHLGGPEPSSILEPHEFVRELHFDLQHLTAAFATQPPLEGWGRIMRYAENCLIELRKFLPAGANEIPEHYFRTDAAKAARAAHAEWFRTAHFDAQQIIFERMVELGKAEMARREAAPPSSAPPAALPPMVPPLSPASIKLHAEWLADRPGQRLHAVGTDATGKRLSAIDLTGAIFERVTLDQADLSFTRFHGATLTGVRARGAGFASAMLAGTTIVGCDFTAAGMPIANLGDATIEDSTFAGATLERTTWYRSKVSRTSFADCTLHDAGIDKAVFTDCDFRGADLGIVKVGLLGTSMDAEFIRCDLRDTNWEGRELFRVKLVDCKLAGTRGRARPERTIIERPDLSPAGDGSHIGGERDVLLLWGIDPDAPKPVPESAKLRELVYDLTDDEGDYLEHFLGGKGITVRKRLLRRGTELRHEIRTREHVDTPIAPMIETQLARYRYAQQRRREHPEEYENPDGSEKSSRQVFVEALINNAIDSGESLESLVARLVALGMTVDEAHQAIIDPRTAPSPARKSPS